MSLEWKTEGAMDGESDDEKDDKLVWNDERRETGNDKQQLKIG